MAIVGYLPEYTEPILDVDIIPSSPRPLTSVRDAISDLPAPIPENKSSGIDGFTWAQYPASNQDNLSNYARLLRAKPDSAIGCVQAVERQQMGLISGMHSTKHTKKVAARYAATPNGKADPISKSYRLKWSGQSPTLRAGTGADKGSFQAVRPLHPSEGRVITVREAARLQGFPDWFTFHRTKWHSFRMIGNSVSPLVSKGIMQKIRDKIFEEVAA